MRIKRPSIPILLVWMSGLFIGALFGPRIHVLYWSGVLDWYPGIVVKNRACMRLATSEMGSYSLYSRVTSPDKMVRGLSVWTLARTERPDFAVALFGRIPEARVDDRLDILAGLVDFPRQYQFLLDVLRLELENKKNSPLVKTEISELLRSIKEAEEKSESRAVLRRSGEHGSVDHKEKGDAGGVEEAPVLTPRAPQ